MTLYPVLSALLGYPEAPLQAAMPEIEQALDAWPAARAVLAPLTGPLRESPLIALQEQYVATFDRTPAHSLHLFEHVHGESRDRRLRAGGERVARLRAAVPGVPRRAGR
jgi:nitrate reductase delta subunit